MVENPIVNRVAFEGNHKLSDDQLRQGAATAAARRVHRRAGARPTGSISSICMPSKGYFDATVEPKIIHLDQNRVDVVFQINDGSATLISKIVIQRQPGVQRGPAAPR